MKDAIVVSKPLSEGLVEAQKKRDKKSARAAFKEKQFQNLSNTEKDELLKVLAISAGVIDE